MTITQEVEKPLEVGRVPAALGLAHLASGGPPGLLAPHPSCKSRLCLSSRGPHLASPNPDAFALTPQERSHMKYSASFNLKLLLLLSVY